MAEISVMQPQSRTRHYAAPSVIQKSIEFIKLESGSGCVVVLFHYSGQAGPKSGEKIDEIRLQVALDC